jgi:hypothetical protein
VIGVFFLTFTLLAQMCSAAIAYTLLAQRCSLAIAALAYLRQHLQRDSMGVAGTDTHPHKLICISPPTVCLCELLRLQHV